MERTAPTLLETATLGGGCFWCLEAVFEQLKGVHEVVNGYAGGTTANPTYETVCGGRTGHAEVVQVTFDSAVLSYRELLEVFFSIHDPTTPDRQGADVGTQYRSVIFTHSAAQEATAKAVIAELGDEKIFDDAIVTVVRPLERFYRAEAYHQRYYASNPDQGYCRAIISPKLAKFRTKWQSKLRAGSPPP